MLVQTVADNELILGADLDSIQYSLALAGRFACGLFYSHKGSVMIHFAEAVSLP